MVFYQTGFDRDSAPNASVGLVTISHCIEQAIRLKCTEYDFLGGGHSYKKRLANQTRWLGEIYIPLRPITRTLWRIRKAAISIRKKVRQKNLWASFGSGSFPSA